MTYTVINENNKEQAYALFNTALQNLNNELISLENQNRSRVKLQNRYVDYGNSNACIEIRHKIDKIKKFIRIIETFGTLHLSYEDMTELNMVTYGEE